ncbi:putative cytosolic protein (plasmid) [Roseomonas mucosa]|uniref:Putative cytosolic protein n=1 Tax=Roseomonas mucosa TaxID=207340 RepID=A0A4Y1MS61_9PROT|nr:hypothetical protein [Roseomonas mucosa]AWV20354.1 putative cytosolic protein [Roseomonas mucosa]
MALLTPEQDTALAGLSGGLLGLSQALLKAGQGGVPFQRTGLLSGIGQGFAGFGQGAEEARKLALQEQTRATQQGLLNQKLSDQKRQQAALDTALATMPQDQRAAFSVLSPDDAGKLLADRAQRKADWQELQPVLGAMGLSVPGGAAPAAASAATAPASAALPATLPVGRTSYAMTPENLRRQAGFESGGNAAARNPRSSALGTQQFIDSTWQQFIQENPEVFQGMSREQAMSMRSDPRYADLGAQWYAQKGGEVLQQAGLPVTQSNLALHHRFGPGDAPKVIAADPATPMEQLVSPAVIGANPDLQGKTAGQVRGTYAMRYGNAAAPAGAPAATTSPATQGSPVDRNLIFGLSVAAAKGNKAAATLLPVIQGLTKQEADAVVVSPGGALVDKRTGRVVYQAPDREDNQLVSVMGPNGPVLVPRSQAAGQTPYSAPQVAIDQRGTSTYDQERGKAAAAAVGTLESQAAAAPGTLRQLDQVERAMQRFQTGMGAGARMTLGQAAQALGFKDGALPAGMSKDAIASAEQIQSLTGQMVMSLIGAGGFPTNNFSDADRAFLERIQPGIENTPGGNRLIIAAARAKAMRDAEIGQAWREWRKENGDSLTSAQEFQLTRVPQIAGRDILAPMFQDAVPAEPQAGPSARAQATPQLPARPPALPAGSQYSPSRGQWRDPSGRIYDREGKPVQ